jgi:hypothetical protein
VRLLGLSAPDTCRRPAIRPGHAAVCVVSFRSGPSLPQGRHQVPRSLNHGLAPAPVVGLAPRVLPLISQVALARRSSGGFSPFSAPPARSDLIAGPARHTLVPGALSCRRAQSATDLIPLRFRGSRLPRPCDGSLWFVTARIIRPHWLTVATPGASTGLRSPGSVETLTKPGRNSARGRFLFCPKHRFRFLVASLRTAARRRGFPGVANTGRCDPPRGNR